MNESSEPKPDKLDDRGADEVVRDPSPRPVQIEEPDFVGDTAI